MALTKQDILKNATVVEESNPIPALDGETVQIRRLRDSEYREYQQMVMENINLKKRLDKDSIEKLKSVDSHEDEIAVLQELGADINMSDLYKRDREASYLICKYGLSVNDEEWTKEEVGMLPKDAPKQIADEILRITKMEEEDIEEEMETFREE